MDGHGLREGLVGDAGVEPAHGLGVLPGALLEQDLLGVLPHMQGGVGIAVAQRVQGEAHQIHAAAGVLHDPPELGSSRRPHPVADVLLAELI